MCAICAFLDLCIEKYLKLVYSMLIPCVIAGYVIKIHPDNENRVHKNSHFTISISSSKIHSSVRISLSYRCCLNSFILAFAFFFQTSVDIYIYIYIFITCSVNQSMSCIKS
jgi:hypothetical protein